MPKVYNAPPGFVMNPAGLTGELRDEIARLQNQVDNLAMMLRKCAHRLRCNGHEDLSADAVGLLRRLDLLGSPLRDGA